MEQNHVVKLDEISGKDFIYQYTYRFSQKLPVPLQLTPCILRLASLLFKIKLSKKYLLSTT